MHYFGLLLQPDFFTGKTFKEVLIIKDLYSVNEAIRDREVRVIGSDGQMIGVMSSAQAQRLADDQELDLVKISPNAIPPVCKIMDYSKFKYEQSKREKENRKNQTIVEIKAFHDNRRGRHRRQNQAMPEIS